MYYTRDYQSIWLVVWNMAFIFPYIGDVIIPTDALHHFSEGWLNHQVSLECHANEIHIDHAINNSQMIPSLSPGTLSFSIGNGETFWKINHVEIFRLPGLIKVMFHSYLSFMTIYR
jgi:hypothetical protein